MSDLPSPARRGEFAAAPYLDDAICYALEAPGKRLRSQLTIAVACMLAPEARDAAAAVGDAIELLHTYSLIHDDLPPMDDDDMRRGRASLHRAFDEATAILAGDGLQALAFERLASIEALTPDVRIEVIRSISQAVGLQGMVGGQAIDLASEGEALNIDELQRLHGLKTGALIAAAVDTGALCAGADQAVREQLKKFSSGIGLGFQVMDDVLDATASSEVLGKTAGKDRATNKSTYVSLLGVERASAEATRLLEEALTALKPWGSAAEPVREIARQMIERRA